MSQGLGSFQLKNVDDFRYMARLVGDKLRNPNFQASNREAFLKTLLE